MAFTSRGLGLCGASVYRFLYLLAICLILSSSFVLLAQPATVDEQTAIQIEALNRLKGMDLESNPALKAAVLRVLEKTRGTPQFVEIVREFKLPCYGQALLDYAIEHPAQTSGLEAFKLALAELGRSAIEALIATDKAPAAIQLIGNSNDKELQPLLHTVVRDPKQPSDVRKEAVRALAQSQDGAKFLLELARDGELPAEVRLTASSELNRAPWPEVKSAALQLLPLPQAQNAEPLPPLSELMRRQGDPKRGQKIYESETAACASCHQVDGRGIDVGPNLSEIGAKLGKDALYEAILDPSAGISFGYEGWSIELKSGDEFFGIITSETPEELSLKAQTGVVSKIKKVDIARRQKSTTSIMPAGLQLTMSAQDLVDLVEYLSTLKKTELR